MVAPSISCYMDLGVGKRNTGFLRLSGVLWGVQEGVVGSRCVLWGCWKEPWGGGKCRGLQKDVVGGGIRCCGCRNML